MVLCVMSRAVFAAPAGVIISSKAASSASVLLINLKHGKKEHHFQVTLFFQLFLHIPEVNICVLIPKYVSYIYNNNI